MIFPNDQKSQTQSYSRKLVPKDFRKIFNLKSASQDPSNASLSEREATVDLQFASHSVSVKLKNVSSI